MSQMNNGFVDLSRRAFGMDGKKSNVPFEQITAGPNEDLTQPRIIYHRSAEIEATAEDKYKLIDPMTFEPKDYVGRLRYHQSLYQLPDGRVILTPPTVEAVT